ncbi:MAG: ferredoxin-NADP reductase [Thermoanaerobaculia bacterium]
MSEAIEGIQRLEEYDTSARVRARLVASQRITPASSEDEVRELLLEVDRGDFSWEIGQSVGVVAPGAAEFGKKEHFRLYSIADLLETGPSGLPRIKLAVRRCSYIDDYSGERYPGVASNYLCDLQPGAELDLAGPFGLAFPVPEEHDANLILIGSGTGIAPFRALVKHIYRDVRDWRGLVWLLYGAKSGLELLYMNEERDDFAQYYDEETFRAFKALSPRPNWSDPIAWDQAIEERGEELWDLLGNSKTYVYVAGLEKSIAGLDSVLARLAGSKEKWQRRKAELAAGMRWVELIY